MPGFLKLLCGLCKCMCACVCLSLRLLITSGMMWSDMDPIWLVKQVLQLFMAAVVIIVNRCGLSMILCYRNQVNKCKLVLYKLLLHF